MKTAAYTTAVTLAHAFAYKGYKTLLVDLDAQGHCALSLGIVRTPDVYALIDKGELHVKRTGRTHLYLISGDENL